MTTNITPTNFRRKFELYPDAPFKKYIELYEQAFDIDLYAYRVSFRCEDELIEKLDDLRDKGIFEYKEI